MPMATFPDIFNGLLVRSILRMWVQNLKFVALPVPEMGSQKWSLGGVANLQSRDRGRRGSGMVPSERALVSSSYRPSLQIIPLTTCFPEILDWSFEWELGVPIGPPIHSVFCSIFTRFRDIAAFVLKHTSFPHPTSSLLKISLCSLGSRWMVFGLR